MTALAVSVVNVQRFRNERGKTVRQFATRPVHLGFVAVGTLPQIGFKAVRDRSPKTLFLDSLQFLVLNLGGFSRRTLRDIEFHFLIGPRHVVDRETPMGADRVCHLHVLPSECFIRQVVVVGVAFVEHDDVSDFRAALHCTLRALLLQETGERVCVLHGFIDDLFSARQISRPRGIHEVVEHLNWGASHWLALSSLISDR